MILKLFYNHHIRIKYRIKLIRKILIELSYRKIFYEYINILPIVKIFLKFTENIKKSLIQLLFFNLTLKFYLKLK